MTFTAARRRPRGVTVMGLVGGLLLACTVAPAGALVRFGRGVFIGGHDFSHQTYGPGRRAVIRLSRSRPPHPGCAWHADGRGGRVKLCRLQTVHRPPR